MSIFKLGFRVSSWNIKIYKQSKPLTQYTHSLHFESKVLSVRLILGCQMATIFWPQCRMSVWKNRQYRLSENTPLRDLIIKSETTLGKKWGQNGSIKVPLASLRASIKAAVDCFRGLLQNGLFQILLDISPLFNYYEHGNVRFTETLSDMIEEE